MRESPLGDSDRGSAGCSKMGPERPSLRLAPTAAVRVGSGACSSMVSASCRSPRTRPRRLRYVSLRIRSFSSRDSSAGIGGRTPASMPRGRAAGTGGAGNRVRRPNPCFGFLNTRALATSTLPCHHALARRAIPRAGSTNMTLAICFDAPATSSLQKFDGDQPFSPALLVCLQRLASLEVRDDDVVHGAVYVRELDHVLEIGRLDVGHELLGSTGFA